MSSVDTTAPSVEEQEQVRCLNAIESLRASGVGHDVDLPQMVVMGEQSSGKTSVVESITGAALPKDEGLCTRFPAIIAMRHTGTRSVVVSIVPAPDRSTPDKARLRGFSWSLASLGEIAPIVAEAVRAITFNDAQNRTFFRDALLVQFSGPECLNLTIVDLPGLFQTAGEGQTDADADFVQKMVEDYINKPRTVVVTVISAQNVLVNQTALRIARKADPEGIRTLGIITKPDLIKSKDEPQKYQSYISLLNDEVQQLKYGWHVLKNRGPGEAGLDLDFRDEAESLFFDTPDWNMVAQRLKGIRSLCRRLCSLQLDTLRDCLPSLLLEAEAHATRLRAELSESGVTSDLRDLKNQLLSASQTFHRELSKVCTQRWATGGDGRLSLRSNITQTLAQCSKALTEGQSSREVEAMDQQQLVQHVLHELQERNSIPGQIDVVLVADLFRQQTESWEELVSDCIKQLAGFVQKCMVALFELATVESSQVRRGLIEIVVSPTVDCVEGELRHKFETLLGDRTPGTEIDFNVEVYHHVQRSRAEHVRSLVAPLLLDEQHHRYQERFLDAVQEAASDIHLFTANETLACMRAHLKVRPLPASSPSSEPETDSVIPTQAESEKLRLNLKVDSIFPAIRRLLEKVFTPETINSGLTEENIRSIFGDGEDCELARSDLTRKIALLEEAMNTLKETSVNKNNRKRIMDTTESPPPTRASKQAKGLGKATVIGRQTQ